MEKFVARKPEKEVISMRISTELLAAIDEKAAKIGISRNEYINQCIQFAIAHSKDES